MRASRLSMVDGFVITGSPCEMSSKVKPVGTAPRDRLMLTRLLVSGILERPPNDRRGLYAHLCRASLVEMEGILVEVRMFRHKSVLVVDGNFFRFDNASGDRISRVNAGIRGAVRCLGFDRRDRSPDKLAATGERPKGLKENGKARLELR